jgi:NADH dehydrogenase
MNRPNIVILGAGYGGIMTTLKLQKTLRINEANITLVNINDYHYQTTWLHESAAGTLHHDQIRIPIRNIVDLNKVNFVLDKVVCINPEERKVRLESSELSYDILVVGLGFEAATYGIKGLKDHALTMDNINNARLVRDHLNYNFAMYHKEEKANQARLNIVVGGGGFTGVEFLGELANRIPEMCEEYDIDKNLVRIINLEATSSILPGFDPTLVEYAINSLEARGVEFITGAKLMACHPDHVVYEKEGKRFDIPTMNTIWTAGVRANSIVEKSGFETTHGRVKVRDDLRTPEFNDVFVIGDCALVESPESGKAYPPTAQMAIQQAAAAADNIKALVRDKEMEEFKPKISGIVASLGSNDAIGVLLNNQKLLGWKATFIKKLIDNRYLFKLGGLNLLMKNGKFNFFY